MNGTGLNPGAISARETGPSRGLWLGCSHPVARIYAVDFDASALEEIPDRHNEVEIRKIVGGLESQTLRLPIVDGVLMANTLHFIREQQSLLRRLLTVTDRFLVVEYERSKSNRWGPYPVRFERLSQLFSEVGVDQEFAALSTSKNKPPS